MGIYQGVYARVFKAIKIIALFMIKWLGGFWLFRLLNQGKTCVLCYHGFAYKDEYLFRPKLFMRPETFAKRLDWLARSPYNIVSLSEALSHPNESTQVVLTMDDGWASTQELVGDYLTKHKFPLTLYVTSYYVEKQGAVINVALAYVLWQSHGQTLIIDETSLLDTKTYVINKKNRKYIVDELCQQIDKLASFTDRQQELFNIADQLGIDLYSQGKLMFRALTLIEATALQENNINIQLHTHRHCSPQKEQAFKSEINENISYLQKAKLLNKLVHFCYPSGEYYSKQLPWLTDSGVVSATTVFSGMLEAHTDPLQIPRILDGEDVHQLEFEAELCGLTSFLRKLCYQKRKN
jgi:peptidoglycan/xylan/chitin deacetylase (PgdA/CDA1 family)